MSRYRFAADEAEKLTKHGIDLTVYGYDHDSARATVVHVAVSSGHFEEFYNVVSTYIYCVVAGKGTFYLDGEAVAVRAGDLIVAPPHTRIYYFGSMQMVLTVSPVFDEGDERHVRFVRRDESPYV